MGHYLSDFETDEEREHRTVLRPMKAEYDMFIKEHDRGILHSGDWLSKMDRSKKTLTEKGYL